ncbi:DMT family transporter [Pseudomonas sp. GCM10022186]|uniref:DMT family transporter n=1 Tax=Pseudomonas sp. GCM10022186 TaxID=3252650 RepID=UPI0036080CF0
MPSIQSLLLLLLALGAGAVVPLQAGANALLGRGLGHPLWATLVSLLLSIAVLLPLLLALRVPLPSFALAAKAPLWAWTGGVYGVCFVSLALILAPKLGVSGFVAAAVAGQMLAALALDHFGLMGLPERSLNPGKLLGAALLVLGVVVIQAFSTQAAPVLERAGG